MQAAILAIGDELICGYRLDTNSQTISRHLASVPVEVVLHLAVGDEIETIHRALHMALNLADVIVITGGLGPTEDDLTRQAVAAYFGLPLVENAEALAHIEQRFARYRRAMPPSNVIQAHVPAGSDIILNQRGTAAGFHLPVHGKHIFATPGIPYEMEGMLEGFIMPRLRALAGTGQHIRRVALKVFGLPESGINERIRPMMARGRNPLLGLLPHRGTITIELTATGKTAAKVEALMAADLATLRAELGHYVISEDERDLPQVVADLLLERGLTLAVAELGTAGLLVARLTEPEGSERWLRRGLAFGSLQDVLELTAQGLDATGEEIARALALLARQTGAADIGLGAGPVIVPADSTAQRPYGIVHVAVNLNGSEVSREISFNGDRLRVRQWACDSALALLRLSLLRQSYESGGSLW